MIGALLASRISGGRHGLGAWLMFGLAALIPAVRGQDSVTDNAPLFQGGSPYDPPAFHDDSPSAGFNYGRGSERYELRRLPVFFPPLPPRLDEYLEPPALQQSRRVAPAELAAYVNEPFYAPLSTRLSQNDLKPRLRALLDTYRTAKSALQNELHTRLAALESAEPAVRERELAAFAVQQTPRIAALEKSADELRADLIEGGLFSESADWNDHRSWQLGVSQFRSSTEAILAQYQVMRAAVFYQKGLLPAQRRLAREIAIELAEIGGQLMTNGEAVTDPVAYADSNPPLFFSPETARVRLPPSLPVDIAREVSMYEHDKSALKQELRAALYAGDGAHFAFLRTHALEGLAQRQEPRIAALEALAEKIRHDLAFEVGAAPAATVAPLPPTLTARLAALIEDKRNAHNNVLALVDQIKRLISVTRVDASQDPGGRPKLSVVVSPEDRTEAKLKPVRELVARYNAENLSRLDAIEKENAALHRDVVDFVRAGPRVDDAEKTATELLDQATSAIERRDESVRYKDYRTAVFEPGLSPEQRRLLFDGALVALDLPLPGSERPMMGLR